MASSKARLACVLSTLSMTALSVLWACEEDGGGGAAFLDLDGAPSGYDASVYDAPVDESDATLPADAAPDVHAHPLQGIWHGTGAQAGAEWTILVDLLDGEPNGPPGTVVGVISYPSVACGGTLVISDAGVPDASTVDGGGPSLTLHESLSANCVLEGEDTFTLMPDGGVFYEWRSAPGAAPLALGSLTRVDDVGAATAAFRGVWRSGDLNQNNLRPVLVSVSRDDALGAASGTFVVAAEDGVSACAGHWTLAGKTATSLTLTEVFDDGQSACTGPGSATLQAIAGALTYTRVLDGGADAAAIPLERF